MTPSASLKGNSDMETTKKIRLSEGKRSLKFSQARGLWQAYCGGEYLPLACGSYPSEAIKELTDWYEIPEGREITIHGGSTQGKTIRVISNQDAATQN